MPEQSSAGAPPLPPVAARVRCLNILSFVIMAVFSHIPAGRDGCAGGLSEPAPPPVPLVDDDYLLRCETRPVGTHARAVLSCGLVPASAQC
jgi:hypothetical protein